MVIFLKTINQTTFILRFKNPNISPLKPQKSPKPLPGPVAHLVSKPLATSSRLISPAPWTPAILAFSALLNSPLPSSSPPNSYRQAFAFSVSGPLRPGFLYLCLFPVIHVSA